MLKEKRKPIILWRLRLGATSLVKLERDIDGITVTHGNKAAIYGISHIADI